VHGRVVIRDQKPLSETKLAKCLRDGLTVQEWLRLLNGKVFFWVDERRLEGLRQARAYRSKRQLVLTVDTSALLERHAERITLSNMNTGTTSPFAHPRGVSTFSSLDGSRRRVVELAVERGVPDIAPLILRAEEIGGGEPDAVVFER